MNCRRSIATRRRGNARLRAAGVGRYPLTAGEYWLAASERGNVNALYRSLGMTSFQLVERFGRARRHMAPPPCVELDGLRRQTEYVSQMQALQAA